MAKTAPVLAPEDTPRIGVRQGVPGHRLHQKAGEGDPRPRHGGEQDTGKPDVPQDGVLDVKKPFRVHQMAALLQHHPKRDERGAELQRQHTAGQKGQDEQYEFQSGGDGDSHGHSSFSDDGRIYACRRDSAGKLSEDIAAYYQRTRSGLSVCRHRPHIIRMLSIY